MPLTGSITAAISFIQTKVSDLSVPSAPITVGPRFEFADGVGLNQADRIFADTRTGAGNDDLDLVGTALTDIYGAAFSLARIKGLYVMNSPANGGDLVIGNVTNGIVAFFGAATHSIAVPPGGMFLWVGPTAAGKTLTAGTADLLRINVTGPYDIVIIGGAT